MNPSLKRALWCRWFHRWHIDQHPAPPVVSRDPSGSGAYLALSAGPYRRHWCNACEDAVMGSRACKRWWSAPAGTA